MNSASSKTVIICEKQTNLDLLNNTSQCSCDNCDSYHCFVLRNRTHCSCNKCPILQAKIDKNKSSENTLKASVHNRDSFVKEFTYDNSNIKTINISKHSRISSDSKDKMKERNIASTELSISTDFPCKEFDFRSNTAKLSALIMNLPYKEFRETISYNKPDTTKINKLSKLDIFRRIKDAYKACSCKVCECIVGKAATYNDFCKCKPCECKDCVASWNLFKFDVNDQLGYIGCSCIRCDKKECKGLVKKSLSEPRYCDCSQCDCTKRFETFNEPCNCRPCECIECKSYSTSKLRTVIVSRVGEDAPRNICSCSPCDCADCGQNHPMVSNLRHEMSTGISRPINCNCENCISQSCESNDNETCLCEIQKRVMKKPVEKDTRDYDIHRASINNKSLIDKPKSSTIAMYTALGESCPTFELLGDACFCGECECLVCNRKHETANAIKASRLFEALQETPSILNDNTCNCLPCECEVCSYNNRCYGRDLKSCACDVCDCLKCEGLMSWSQKDYKAKNKTVIKSYNKNLCKCKPCECAECQSMLYNCTGDSDCCSNWLENSKIITPGKFENSKTYLKALPKKHYGLKMKHNVKVHDTDSNEKPLKDLSKIESLIKSNIKNIPKPAQEMNRTNHTCDMCMKYAKANISRFNRSSSQMSNAFESFTSGSDRTFKPNVLEYYNDESTHSTQGDTIKSDSNYEMKLIPGHHTLVRTSSKSTLKKCINEVMNINMDEYTNSHQLNVKTNVIPNQGADNKKIKENEICDKNDSMNYLKKSNAEVSSKIDIEQLCIVKKSISDLDKTRELKEITKRNNQKQIFNINNMSLELEQLLKDANRKYANVKYKNRESHYGIKSNNFTAKDFCQTTYEQSVPQNKAVYNNFISSNIIDSQQQAKACSLELASILKQLKNANNNYCKTPKFDYSTMSHSDVGRGNYNIKETHNSPDKVTNNEVQESTQLKTNYPCDIKNKTVGNLRLETNDKNIFNNNRHSKQNKFNSKSNNDYPLPTTSNNTELIDYLLCAHDEEPFESMYDQSYVIQKKLQRLHLDIRDCTNKDNKISSKSLNQTVKLKPIVVDRYANSNADLFENDALSETLLPSEVKGIKQKFAKTPQPFPSQTTNLEPIYKISSPFVINDVVKHKQCLNTSTSPFSLEESANIINELEPMMIKDICGKEDKQWSILKKNINLYSSPFTKNKGPYLIPTLALEVKNVLRSISGQFNELVNAESSNKSATQNENKTLSEMDSKIQNNLIAASSQACKLSMIEEKGINCKKESSESIPKSRKRLQNLLQTSTYHNKSLESCKSSCDAMKAEFLGLRRVSDHTVLVKWKVPQNVSNVQGYELLVEGRAVQQILGPSRCMAVVSCLPHLDQVLITIRTIVNPTQQRDHLPTATVVYHPRIR